MQIPQEAKMLVHGLWFSGARASFAARRARFEREREALGIASYELLETREKRLANQIMQRLRRAASPPDAVEIIQLRPDAPRVGEVLDRWRRTAACALDSLDCERSFLLSGIPVRRLQSSRKSVRVVWLGRGLPQLSEDAFASHYLNVHGPLVAGYARLIGLRGYTQLRDAVDDERALLVDAGMGRAPPPVFGELIFELIPDLRNSFSAQRRAIREIAEDERRHMDFSRSIMLLA